MFRHSGQDFIIEYQHSRPRDGKQGFTVCQIMDGDRQLISRGAAFQHVKDRWSPPVGRRISLDRALRGLAFGEDREQRRAFYEAYFESKGRRRA
jgi:hypothetical protein